MSWRRLSALLRPSVDREVDDELAFHLEMRARELEAQGMEPRAARAAAERRFRDLQATRRACRQIAQGRNRAERRREWWGELALDLGFALRQMGRKALVFRQGLRPALLGMALGAAGALLAGRALQAVLFGVGAADPLTLVEVAALLFVVAGLASVLPALRAARVDPARALAEG